MKEGEGARLISRGKELDFHYSEGVRGAWVVLWVVMGVVHRRR